MVLFIMKCFRTFLPYLNYVDDYIRREREESEAMLNVDQISQFQWHCLRKMYLSLLCISASSTLGSYLTEYIGSSLALFGASVSFCCFHIISPWHEKKRACMVSLGAFFGWAFVNPCLIWFLGVDAGFTLALLSATCVGFGCFWVTSKWTDRFGRVYFKNAMSLCCLLVPICLLFCSSVFGGDSTHKLCPFVLLFMLYVIEYSQFVMMKVSGGENDYVMHAIRLFVAFPSVPTWHQGSDEARRGLAEMRVQVQAIFS